MSTLNLTKIAEPNTPATDTSEFYVDIVDGRGKQKDWRGIVSTLTEDGSKDRNILTNGGMTVQQRVAIASTAIPGISTTTRAGQVADCWAVTASVATSVNWQQVDASGAPETGLLNRYYGSIISSSAGKKVMISQFILASEIMHLRGQKVRLSVKTLQKVGTVGQTYWLGLLQLTSSGTVDVCPAFQTGAWSTSTGVDPAWGTNLSPLTPDATVTPENGAVTGNFLGITTTAAWQRSSCVWTVPSNCKNLVVVLFANATGGITDNFSVTEFRLSQGPEIIDWVSLPLAWELERCQRRYCKSFPLTTVPAASLSEAAAGSGAAGIIGKAAATALACIINVQFPVRMWKTPSVTLFTPVGAGAVPYRITGTTPAVQTAVAQRGLTDRGLTVTATGDANGAVGDLVGVHYVAEAEFIT